MKQHFTILIVLAGLILSSSQHSHGNDRLAYRKTLQWKEPRVVFYDAKPAAYVQKTPFLSDVQISPFGDQFGPKLATRSNGEIFCAYFTSDSITVATSTNAGESWSLKFSILWGQAGASVFDMDFMLAEGDSTCLFLPHIVYYNGVDIGQLIVYRLNLKNASAGFRYVREFPSPLIIESPRIVSDVKDSTRYRLRAAWMVKGGSSDTVFYANSLDQGWSWSSPVKAYVDPSGSIANLSVAYGNGGWWMAFDKAGAIYFKNLFSGNPDNVSRLNQSYYRPVLSVAGDLNTFDHTSMSIAFVRRLNQVDVGTYFISTKDGGNHWTPIYSIGGNPAGTRNFNANVSYSSTTKKFYYTSVMQDSLGLPTQYYTISSFYSTIDVPDQLVTFNVKVNDDSVYGSAKADPVILENPAKGGLPMLTWRNWSGSGEGKIMFDAAYWGMANAGTAAYELPNALRLEQNYPNPFNPTTTIQYSVPEKQFVSLKVYDLLGREVAMLFEGERLAGNYSAVFDGSSLSSGMYFYRLRSGNSIISKKLLLVR